METFAKLFERFLVFVYHCFDRIVIQGYLPLLSRSEHIVYFFRDVHGIYPITPQALAKRTPEYRAWVEGYARNHKIPMKRPKKDESKEEFVRPHLQRMERQNKHGVYFIIPSMEMSRTFCSTPPKYPTDDLFVHTAHNEFNVSRALLFHAKTPRDRKGRKEDVGGRMLRDFGV